ncbi:major facilitator superfamily domain-containing protein [Kockovaella imperatae]|uniref:Major facilitator superfamily domain-containing protein n=1 Tax=Kockovaella imperatae TaxID=4999 RepID=A0A1Y1UAP6_9TREE|nr:major facilitator superfamily domain-containing protein [Kockovaella imperatae]ORX35110.1 major facilitator superfamily domain-containing protein [Kockovaella imperatae]
MSSKGSIKGAGSANERSRLLPNPNPTVRYDTERPLESPDSLAPPNLDEILHRKRPWYRSLFSFNTGRRGQLVLTCTSIGLSSLQANGVYCWPTYGPVVVRQMELTGPQAQTIAVGGILGVYIMAAPLGSLTDRYGPRFGSLLSGVLAAVGYLGFAFILSVAGPETPYVNVYLTIAFCLVGAATVGSYFACLTCASLSFPHYPTLSLSVPLSLLGLSSLFLSSFSSLSTFQSPAPNPELLPVRFLTFLGILCPAINLFSAIFMKTIPPLPPKIKLVTDAQNDEDSDAEEEAYDALAEATMAMSQSLHLDERSPWLLGGYEAALEEVEAMQKGTAKQWTAWDLVKDWEGFWALGVILAFCIGPCETIIASIGTILTSLLPPALDEPAPSTVALFTNTIIVLNAPNALTLRNKHVSIISLTSTISRLIAGALADYLCPPVKAVPRRPSDPSTPLSEDGGEPRPTPQTHKFIRTRPVIMYRSVFAGICSVILAMLLAWCAGVLQTEKGLWVLSAGVGTAYGFLFTLSPAIISTHYGPSSFGLAWGMVSYFTALGSVLFSYLYALTSSAVARQSSHLPSTLTKASEKALMCYGAKCFQPSLWVAAAGSLVAGMGFIWIGKRWRV